MTTATKSGLGYEVAVGLLAGPEELRRLRESRHRGVMARLWRRFAQHLEHDDATRAIPDLALAAAVTGRSDFAKAAITRALHIAHQPHWVDWEAGCIGLSGMHHAHNLALATDWLWPLLNRDQREALLGALIAKAQENLTRAPAGVRDEDGEGQLLFVRRMDKDDRCCLHPHPASVNNWDLWFASGIYLIAALAERAWLKPDAAWPALEWGRYYEVGYALDAARIARWKAVAVERITTALASQLGPDGDYAEGPSYASYSGQAMITALTALERVDGLNLWTPGMLALPYWLRNQYLADMSFGVANFNDARIQTAPAAQLLAHIAARGGDPRIQGYAEETLELDDAVPGYLLLLGYTPQVPAEPMTREPATLYQHTGQVVWRTAEDRDGIYFSVKSGAHGGAHQHRDRATFFLSAYGEYLIVDTGDSRYADPPSVPRFDDTRAHNCLLIDGRGQVGSNANPVAGRILEHRHAGRCSTALADATDCYVGMASVRRRVVFPRPDLFVIADRVQGACETLTWLLQGYNGDGRAAWELGGRRAILSRPGAKVYVYFLEPTTRQFVALGTMDNAQAAIMRLETDVPGTAVTAALIPARADDAAPACAWDGEGMTVRFRGQEHTIRRSEDAVVVDGDAYGF
ncbi:MAG TPA: heparinase II/III family protein [Armatimonadota bacterium]|nr:heparinase II/III family protein [Armatimonadota bacterium]